MHLHPRAMSESIIAGKIFNTIIYKQTIKGTIINSADPDQMLHSAAYDTACTVCIKYSDFCEKKIKIEKILFGKET